MKDNDSLKQDMKRIFLKLSELQEGEEFRSYELNNCIESTSKNKSARVLYCIDKLCELGFTIAENEYDNGSYKPIVKYSLLRSIDNKVLFKKYFSNL